MNGKWIWAANAPECENIRVCFADSIDTPKNAQNVTIKITAVSKYLLFLNGERVGYGAARQEPGWCIIDSYELLPLMRRGKNHLAIWVWNYGWSTYQSLPDEGGLWYEIMADGELISVSDEHVRAEYDRGHQSFAPKRNVNLGFGDYYDGRNFLQDWITDSAECENWSNAVVVDAERELIERAMRNFQCVPQYPQNIVSLEEIDKSGQTLTINTRRAFFGDRRDADEITINGIIGFTVCAQHEMEGRIAFPNRTWNGMLGTFRIGEKVYPIKDRERDVAVKIPAGESLMLIQLNGKFDDHYCHIEFRLPEKISFKHRGTDRCCFVIGPTASLVSNTDGRGNIYNDMSPLGDIDRQLFSCSTLEELYSVGEEMKWVESRYVMVDMYILSLNRMAKSVKNCAVLSKHQGILWNNASTTVFELPSAGERSRLLVDFGDIYVGNLEFTVKATAGTVIDIYGFENMYRGEIDYTIGLNNGMRYICRDGWQNYRCFARMGMRYAFITVYNNTSDVEMQKFFMNHTTYSNSNSGSFECNDYLLNRIWEICRHTLENCTEDSFIDSPTYEQTYWTGDAQTSAAVNAFVYGDYELLRHNLVLAKTAFTNSPLGNALTPTDWNTSIPMWSFNWFISFYQYLENSGDETIIYELYDKIREMLLYYASLMTEEGGVLISAWNFVDWAPIDYPACCVPTAYQIQLLYCFDRFENVCRRIGREEDADRFESLKLKAKHYLNEKLWCEERRAYYDSWSPETGFGKTFSIQTHIMALLYGGVESDDRRKLIESYITQNPENFVDVGSPFMLYYLYEVWAKLGRCDEIFEDIALRWGEMLRYETTTCWEVFPGFYENSRTRSYCHAWSAAPASLMQELLLGIKRESDGFKDVSICFPKTKLRWCRGKIPTPQGSILVDWNKDIGKYRLCVPQEISVHGEMPLGFDITIEHTCM